MPKKKDFIAIFKAETEDHLTKLNRGLVELEKRPDNIELVKELNREAHNIKGSARAFGYYEIQEVAHRIEDIFDRVAQKRIEFNSAIAQTVFNGLDVIKSIVEKIAREEPIDVDVSEICRALEQGFAKEKERVETRKEKKPGKKPEEKRTKEADKQKLARPAAPAAIASVQEAVVEEYIRVPIGRINALLNLVGEMIINKMKTSHKVAQAKRLFRITQETQKRIFDLSERVKKKQPAEDKETARLLSQCNVNIQKLREEALNLSGYISMEALRLDPVVDELQARLKEIRMLPCSTIFEGFPRMVRDIAYQESKEVNLEISGEETELDRKVLDGIKTPLMHILRNCIDHGIEKPDQREASGKPRFGTIKLSAYHEAGNVLITIEDDGQGIDPEEIKRITLQKELISEEELAAMTEIETLNIVFMNGYSTSPIITDVSGRGIGLDIVRREIESLKGHVALNAQKDKGTRITLILPLTIAIIQVLMQKIQGKLFAFPMSLVNEILRVKEDEIATVGGQMAIQVRDSTVPVIKLDELLGLQSSSLEERAPSKNGEIPVVITTSLDKRVGFIVDEILGEVEVFVKSLGPHLGKIKNVSGAAVLARGEIMLILDVADLITDSALSHPATSGKKLIPQKKRKEKKILVVEDALSTRELEKSIIEAQGYSVDTAVDGLDALNKVAQCKYDLIVCDVKMPRMEGFELCQTLKQNDEHKDIPVIFVTALDKEEEKRRGIEVGAAAYILKSTFEQTNLLDTIERLIG